MTATTADFRRRLRERVLIFDGAMGTSIQDRSLALDDFGGKEGCNEYLVLTRPQVIREIHASFLTVGCDAVETDTFGASRLVLGEYDLADHTYEINRIAAKLAREVADDFTTPEHPRFVVGSMGPGTRLPSLGQIGWDELVSMYAEQARGLLDGGAQILLIETCQDLLQAKAAIVGCRDSMRASGADVPLMVQVTMEKTGTMLLGTEIGAALTALEPYGLDVIGLNCATGPQEMMEHVRYLSLSRNFGKHEAMAAGYDVTTGQAVITLDADGQHPPEFVDQLIAKWREGFDVVYTVRTNADAATGWKRMTACAPNPRPR